VETEIKLSFSSPSAARKALRQAGFFIQIRRGFESNTLYDTPQGSLRAAGVVIRYRQWHGEHVITYKGPPRLKPGARAGSLHKQRVELETKVADGAPIVATWEAAGLRPGFRYEKYRTVYARQGERGHAMLDETPIGTYVELEGAASWIDGNARLLGFEPSEYIQLSYPALQAEACRKLGIPFGDLVYSPASKST